MVTKIRSISLSEEDNKLVDELNLSPTALIKSKVEEIRETSKISISLLQETMRQRDKFRENFQKAMKFITEEGLYDKYFGINNVLE